MKAETKTCQNCKNQFTIEPEDFNFYEKMQVPAPTFCPTCRWQRIMVFRNERNLYRRKCNATGKEIISIFSTDKPFTVYEQSYWWGDAWDPLSYGREYDFSKPFFQQFRELMERVPLISLLNSNSVNSEWCNHATQNRNCYLCFGAVENENVSYAAHSLTNKESLDLYVCEKNELSYFNTFCERCYRTFFSIRSIDCRNSTFLMDCQNCSDCFGCVNLRNRQYCIFNEQFSKEEYEKRIRGMNLGSQILLEGLQERFKTLSLHLPRRFAYISQRALNATGDNIIGDAKHCFWCFDCLGSFENCKYIMWGGHGNLRDSYDGFGSGDRSELVYQDNGSGWGSRFLFTAIIWGGHDVQYSYNCHESKYLLGCISLRNKEYCILNKQYSKEEYETMLPKITAHMNAEPYVDKKGRVYTYGEYFPIELAPFAYNESVAQEYFPLTKEQALAQGYSWRDPEARQYEITLNAKDLPDHIKNVKDDVLKEIIGCAHQGKCNELCTTAFKIIPQELEFYRKLNLPLPRLCPNCRHYQRLKQRNPLRLWHRSCTCAGEKSENGVYQNQVKHFHGSKHCPNEFETTYAADRPEIVYCEKCYQSEVV